MVFEDLRTHCVFTVGEAFMPPGSEMFRFSPHFGENVLRNGSHEWLPYSRNEVHAQSSNSQFTESVP